MSQRYYTRVQILELLGIDADFLVALEREAVVTADAPRAEAGEYSARMLERVRVADNLVHDLDVNLAGVCIIVRMRERLVGQRRDLEHVLMEAARIQDELAHLGERRELPPEAISIATPSERPWRELSPEQLDMVQAVAEGKKWTDILDGHEADDLTLTKLMVELREAGVVTYDD